MKIKSVRIKNFRSFKDQTIPIGAYNCFVGPNGAGKSTVLSALNIFFQERDGATTDVLNLVDEDFFQKNIGEPVEITVTFQELTDIAQAELAAYVRQGQLSVTACAEYDQNTRTAKVQHRGERLAMTEFKEFFEQVNSKAKVGDLKALFDQLGEKFDLEAAKTKAAMIESLQAFEATNQDKCTLIPSEDDFYGFNGSGKLAKFIQWVYVPAVKDASEEGKEGKNTALGKLISRAVRAKTNFSEELELLRGKTLDDYKKLLVENKASLNEISQSLNQRMTEWAHGGVTLDIEWQSDTLKSVRIDDPVAGIKTGDGSFEGSLARMGHGLQRSYLLALLQELANYDFDDSISLVLGIEEPELYQHPPQARHLSDVLKKLSETDNQILVTSHSPIFVKGKDFEDLRFVIPTNSTVGTTVKAINTASLQARLKVALGETRFKAHDGLLLRLHQALQPNLSEMFFTKFPILVEGLEDISYLSSYLHLADKWDEFRRLGCCLVTANKKSNLVKPLAIAVELGLPVFTIFDSDGDCKECHRQDHERDNKALCGLLGISVDPFPSDDLFGPNYAIWKTNMGDLVERDLGNDFEKVKNKANQYFSYERSVQKCDLWIGELMRLAFDSGLPLPSLEKLCDKILTSARM